MSGTLVVLEEDKVDDGANTSSKNNSENNGNGEGSFVGFGFRGGHHHGLAVDFFSIVSELFFHSEKKLEGDFLAVVFEAMEAAARDEVSVEELPFERGRFSTLTEERKGERSPLYIAA